MHSSDKARRLTFFGDFVCPFSFLSWQALERVAGHFHLDISWHAFELRPAPIPLPDAPSETEWAVVTEVAAAAGSELVRPSLRPRTRKAHEATKYAATIGRAGEMRHAIFDSYFRAGRDIGRIDVLVQIADELGIDRTALKFALDVDTFADDVVGDGQLAHRLEIEGTPAFVVGADVRIGYMSEEHLRDWLKD